MNNERNLAYADRVRDGGALRLPVLFPHATYDVVCETFDSQLAEPMRRDCGDLTERVVDAGHWMPQERADEVTRRDRGLAPPEDYCLLIVPRQFGAPHVHRLRSECIDDT